MIQPKNAEEKRKIEVFKKQGLNEKEITDLIMCDREIDAGKDLFDLPEELKEGAKKATRADTRKYEKTQERLKREEEARQEKISAIKLLMNAVDVVEIIKPEGEFTFKYNDIKYRVNLKKVRKQS